MILQLTMPEFVTEKITEDDAYGYYYGLPSHPRLVARTSSTPLKPPRDALDIGYPAKKVLKTLGQHDQLAAMWTNEVSEEVVMLLKHKKVDWTSVDVIRIGLDGEKSQGPAILWVGVTPSSLTYEAGLIAAYGCKKLLLAYGITDIECEIRESELSRDAGPKLYRPASSGKYTANMRIPLTTSLGQPISTIANQSREGTLGIFIQRDSDHSRLFAITASHVILSPDAERTETYHRNNASQPAIFVTVLREESLATLKDKVKSGIELNNFMLEERDFPEQVKDRAELRKAAATLDESDLNEFGADLNQYWTNPSNRIIGSVYLTPPLGTMYPVPYATDWAVIEIDLSKIDIKSFSGNSIDLGTDLAPSQFTRMMYPNPTTPTGFQWPPNRQLKLYGKISDKEMSKPEYLDEDGEACIMVLKRGRTTGLTVGRANQLLSLTRYAWDGITERTHKEWCIIPRNSEESAFSAGGDSGSIIVDAKGHIGGLLTAGTGLQHGTDITYAIPIEPLIADIERHGFGKVNLHPILQ